MRITKSTPLAAAFAFLALTAATPVLADCFIIPIVNIKICSGGGGGGSGGGAVVAPAPELGTGLLGFLILAGGLYFGSRRRGLNANPLTVPHSAQP